MKLFYDRIYKKSAEQFFTRLKQPGLVRLVDARLNNTSQLAGFTKKPDLQFFLREICQIEYVHLTDLAPTPDILDAYKKNGGDWSVYEQAFLALLAAAASRKRSTRTCWQAGACCAASPRPSIAIAGWWPSIFAGNGATWRSSICDHSPRPPAVLGRMGGGRGS